ncbi:MAG: hypothetical protein GWO24_09035, partial [Akkermansiaceae bacterium]|nr:hypothetical protein [Akkermansiaceae bacterium]
MTVRVRRPAVRDLGATVPLTLEVAGVAAGMVAEVTSTDAEVRPVKGRPAFTFNLAHGRSQRVFTRAGIIPNLENRAGPT